MSVDHGCGMDGGRSPAAARAGHGPRARGETAGRGARHHRLVIGGADAKRAAPTGDQRAAAIGGAHPLRVVMTGARCVIGGNDVTRAVATNEQRRAIGSADAPGTVATSV